MEMESTKKSQNILDHGSANYNHELAACFYKENFTEA